MSFGHSSLSGGCLILAVLGWSGLCVTRVLADEKVQEPTAVSSEPKTNVESTTFRKPVSGKSGLLRLEEELSKSFQALKPTASSLEAAPPPSLNARSGPIRQSKRAKELQDRRKNWIFLTPEELMGTPKSDDFFNLPEERQDGQDGQDKNGLSPLERFYQGLERRKSGKSKPQQRKAENSLNSRDEQGLAHDSDSPDDPSLPSDMRESEKALRKLLGGEKAGSAGNPAHKSVWDVFGLGDKVNSPKEELAHKDYMKRYQEEVLGEPPPVTAGGLTVPFAAPSPQPGATLLSGAPLGGALPSGRPDGFDPLLGTASPTYIPNASPDLSAKAINQWNPMYVPAKVEPPKWNPPPNFEIPRRKF